MHHPRRIHMPRQIPRPHATPPPHTPPPPGAPPQPRENAPAISPVPLVSTPLSDRGRCGNARPQSVLILHPQHRIRQLRKIPLAFPYSSDPRGNASSSRHARINHPCPRPRPRRQLRPIRQPPPPLTTARSPHTAKDSGAAPSAPCTPPQNPFPPKSPPPAPSDATLRPAVDQHRVTPAPNLPADQHQPVLRPPDRRHLQPRLLRKMPQPVPIPVKPRRRPRQRSKR